MYKYMSVILSSEDQIKEINTYALQGWRLVSVVFKGWDAIAYFEKPV